MIARGLTTVTRTNSAGRTPASPRPFEQGYAHSCTQPLTFDAVPTLNSNGAHVRRLVAHVSTTEPFVAEEARRNVDPEEG